MKDFSERQGSSKVVIKTPIGKARHSTAFSLPLEKVQRRHWILEMKEPPEPEHTPRRMPTLPPRPPVHGTSALRTLRPWVQIGAQQTVMEMI